MSEIGSSSSEGIQNLHNEGAVHLRGFARVAESRLRLTELDDQPSDHATSSLKTSLSPPSDMGLNGNIFWPPET